MPKLHKSLLVDNFFASFKLSLVRTSWAKYCEVAFRKNSILIFDDFFIFFFSGGGVGGSFLVPLADFKNEAHLT